MSYTVLGVPSRNGGRTMSEQPDMRQNQAPARDELLEWLRAGLEEQPAPTDMARRALDRWAAEGSRARTHRLSLSVPPVRMLKPIAGAVAIAVLGLLVFRYGSRVPESVSDTAGPVSKDTRSSRVEGAPPTEFAAPLRPQRDRQDTPAPPGSKAPRIKERPTELARVQPPPADQTEQRRPKPPIKSSSQAVPAIPPRSGRDRAQVAETGLAAEATAGAEQRTMANQAMEDGATAPQSLRTAPKSDPSLRLPGVAGGRADKLQSSDLDYLNGESDTPETFQDARLAVRVTLQEASVSVADLLGRLRERSGVEISVPPHVAARPLAVYCEHRPLGTVLRQLGKLFNGVWDTAGAPDRPRYVMGSREMMTFRAQPPASPETTTIAPPSDTQLAAVPVMGDPEAVAIYRERRSEVKGTRSDDWILLPLRP